MISTQRRPIGTRLGIFDSNVDEINTVGAALHLSGVLPWRGVTGSINALRAHEIINAYSLAVFDRHLLGHSQALLDGPASQYPEVLFETRRPQSPLRSVPARLREFSTGKSYRPTRPSSCVFSR